jgi:hypothetical protein
MKMEKLPDILTGTFDIPGLIQKMKRSQSWAAGELNSMILISRSSRKVVLSALHEETEIQSFQSDDSITFHIIEGRIKFQSQNKSVILDKGQKHTLQEKIRYRLKTMEETVLLMTIESNTLMQA